MSEETPKPKPSRHRVERPDEFSKETFEFIAAIDGYKRTHMVSHVSLEQVLDVLAGLNYKRKARVKNELRLLEKAVEAYKQEHARLFPNWSEIFQIVSGLGYKRADKVA